MTPFGDRMDALLALISAAFPARIVTREYRSRDQISDADLTTGVYTLISRGVNGFTNKPGRMAAFGRHKLIVVGQIKLAEGASGKDVEDAEFAMVEELRTVVRGGLPEVIGGLEFLEFAQSGQEEPPYGWIVAVMEIGPSEEA